MTSRLDNRSEILKRIFPEGIPVLWCPTLTHYASDGTIDRARISAHLAHLAPHLKGILVPGSTGDGWELDDTETRQILEITQEQCQRLNLHLLIGALKPKPGETLKSIQETVEWLKVRTKHQDTQRALSAAHVCAFTVCAERGAGLDQTSIAQGLSSFLELGLPIAIYQLPQITQNEISPEVIESLAQKFSNFIMFKDSSWSDRVVQSKRDLRGVFTMRGAEGDYAQWLKRAGGLYDGFLLSTANCFARELQLLINYLDQGKPGDAKELSERLSSVISSVFDLVKEFPSGNPFTNANKAIDHFFAYGARAEKMPPPRLHAGSCLPQDIIQATGRILDQHKFLPTRGYLD